MTQPPRTAKTIVTRTLLGGRIARELILEHDSGATASRPVMTVQTGRGIPFRDDYGVPIERCLFDVNTRLTDQELVRLLFEPAGKWLYVW